MHNWVDLVNAAVQAEVPDYEIMQTMALFLGKLEANETGDVVIKRLAKFFKFDPVPKLILKQSIS